MQFRTNYAKLDPAPCWIWRGPKAKGNRAAFHYEFRNKSKVCSAARFAWIAHNQKEIPRDLEVHHECYNPICVNPYHLFLLTTEENLMDVAYREELFKLEIELGERDPDSLKRLR